MFSFELKLVTTVHNIPCSIVTDLRISRSWVFGTLFHIVEICSCRVPPNSRGKYNEGDHFKNTAMNISARLHRVLLCSFLASTLLCTPFTVAARAEVIRAFDATIRLQKDTTLDVTETIVMDFEDAQRHGIYRNLPVVYNRHGGQYSIYVRIVSVTDEKGRGWRFTTSRSGRDLNIKIGDPNRTFSGVHTYKLRYLVRRAVNFFNGAPEVYWNATGDQWPFAMTQVAARFYPPPGVGTAQVKTACFMGPPGSTTPASIQSKADNIIFYTYNLSPGSGLTFVAGLPKDSVVAPSTLQNLLWILADWWPAFALPLAALALLTMLYLRGGRDADIGQAVAVEWNPPTELTPAEVGTLVDEHCDMADVVSTLVDLAARGYLVIEQTQSEKFLFFSSKDYIFHKLQHTPGANEPALLKHEQEFLRGLFLGSDEVSLSSLKNKFYTYLPDIRSGIFDALMNKNLFSSNPESTRTAYAGVGIVAAILGFVLLFVLSSIGKSAWGAGLLGSGVLCLLFARAMPAKTVAGSKMLVKCLGFARFVEVAEKERIKVLAQNDPTIFGRMLPYAMVLGVADQWADAFKDLLHEPPNWYIGPSYSVFSPNMFVNDLGNGMNTMGNTFSSKPQSQAGSGGSGFSSGGGFSGGGFGGGGGGSW